MQNHLLGGGSEDHSVRHAVGRLEFPRRGEAEEWSQGPCHRGVGYRKTLLALSCVRVKGFRVRAQSEVVEGDSQLSGWLVVGLFSGCWFLCCGASFASRGIRAVLIEFPSPFSTAMYQVLRISTQCLSCARQGFPRSLSGADFTLVCRTICRCWPRQDRWTRYPRHEDGQTSV